MVGNFEGTFLFWCVNQVINNQSYFNGLRLYVRRLKRLVVLSY